MTSSNVYLEMLGHNDGHIAENVGGLVITHILRIIRLFVLATESPPTLLHLTFGSFKVSVIICLISSRFCLFFTLLIVMYSHHLASTSSNSSTFFLLGFVNCFSLSTKSAISCSTFGFTRFPFSKTAFPLTLHLPFVVFGRFRFYPDSASFSLLCVFIFSLILIKKNLTVYRLL